MNVLFYLYPGLLPPGSECNAAWTILLSQFCNVLARSRHGNYCIVTGMRFSGYLGNLPDTVHTVLINETELYNSIRRVDQYAATPSALSWLANNEDDNSHTAIALLLKQITSECKGFEPDIIITYGMNARYMRSAWPNAVIMHAEKVNFKRTLNTFSMSFDHMGTYSSSGASCVNQNFLEKKVSPQSLTLVSDFREWNNKLLQEADPFADCDFRKKFKSLVLFPLQVATNSFLHDQTTRFEYLYDFLTQTPNDVGVIVTEDVTSGEVYEEPLSVSNFNYLKKTFPNFIFHPYFRKHFSASQNLISHVDGVWTVFLNIGYQTLLNNKHLGTPLKSHMRNVAHSHSPKHLFKILQHKPEDRQCFLAWCLENYLVPEYILNDGLYLYNYLEERLETIKSVTDPLDGFIPIASEEILRAAWLNNNNLVKLKKLISTATVQVHQKCISNLSLVKSQSSIYNLKLNKRPDVIAARNKQYGNKIKYILLNETSSIEQGLHLGCNVVTQFIYDQLAKSGLGWFGTANFAVECSLLQDKAGFDDVQLVLFNGEGSLHHDSERCLELLKFCAYMKSRGCCCVLINSVWYENTDVTGSYLDLFDIVSVRESISANAIREWRPDIRVVADLSFAAFNGQLASFQRQPLVLSNKAPLAVIDDVIKPVAVQLQSFAEFHNFPFFLMGPLHISDFIESPLSGYEVSNEVFPRILQNYLDISNAHGCLTGRFHGLISSLSAGVPVVCLRSNTPKIEGLLEDLSIRDISLLPENWLALGNNERLDIVNVYLSRWNENVLVSIQDNIKSLVADIRTLFADIGSLIR